MSKIQHSLTICWHIISSYLTYICRCFPASTIANHSGLPWTENPALSTVTIRIATRCYQLIIFTKVVTSVSTRSLWFLQSLFESPLIWSNAGKFGHIIINQIVADGSSSRHCGRELCDKFFSDVYVWSVGTKFHGNQSRDVWARLSRSHARTDQHLSIHATGIYKS